MINPFRREPLYHYPLDRFSIKSPILYRPEHRVVHVGGGPGRNHPRELNVNVQVMENVDIVGSAERLPFGDSTVDVIISNAVLEHVRDFDAAVAQMHRVLKPGGYLYVEIPFVQRYHTSDAYGVRFDDYRRLTLSGLKQVFEFCLPLDVGVCVGPISTLAQMSFAFLRDLRVEPRYRQLVDRAYYFFGNLIVWLDGMLSDAVIRRSTIPSGVYFFGRKHDETSGVLQRLPQPSTAFPRDIAARITLVERNDQDLVIRAKNTGSTTWLRASPLAWGSVNLGLQPVIEGRLSPDFKRVPLPHDVPPGASVDLSIDLSSLVGVSDLTLDMVVEGLCWFKDRGSRPLKVHVGRTRKVRERRRQAYSGKQAA